MQSYKVKDLMGMHPVVISPDISLKEAAEKMLLLDYGVLPVGTPDHLIGMITDRDITVRAVSRGRDPSRTKVADVMTNRVFFIYEEDELDLAAETFKRFRVNRLIVKDSREKLVGILSLNALIKEKADTAALAGFVRQLADYNHRQAA